jgi:hypothetical protein
MAHFVTIPSKSRFMGMKFTQYVDFFFLCGIYINMNAKAAILDKKHRKFQA